MSRRRRACVSIRRERSPVEQPECEPRFSLRLLLLVGTAVLLGACGSASVPPTSTHYGPGVSGTSGTTGGTGSGSSTSTTAPPGWSYPIPAVTIQGTSLLVPLHGTGQFAGTCVSSSPPTSLKPVIISSSEIQCADVTTPTQGVSLPSNACLPSETNLTLSTGGTSVFSAGVPIDFTAQLTNAGSQSCVVHAGLATVGFFVYSMQTDSLVWDSAGPLTDVEVEPPYDYKVVSAGQSINAPLSSVWNQQECSASTCDSGSALGAGSYEVEVIWGDVGTVGATITIE